MKKYINRFYGVGIVIALFIIICIFSMFQYFDSFLTKEVEKSLKDRNNFIAESINAELQIKAQIVDNVALFIETYENPDQQKLLHYFEEILQDNENCESIYYGSAENEMINGSGWTPPEGFDLRTRPWYLNAADQKALVFTDVFLNASEDKRIVTIAKPVIKNNTVAGVIGADISIDNIINLIEDQKSSYGLSFLIDGEQVIIAQSKSLESDNRDLDDLAADLSKQYRDHNTDIISTTIDGKKGYALFTAIPSTNLTLGTFIPIEIYSTYQKQWFYGLALTLLTVVGILLIMFFLQKKIILKPLVALDQDIKGITVTENTNYRVPMIKSDPFQLIRESINQILNEISQQHAMLLESKLRLEISEKRKHAMISVMPDIIFIFDVDGTFIDCQTNNSDLYVSKTEIVGKNIRETMPGHIADLSIKSIQETLITGELQSFDYQLKLNGQTKYYEARMVKSSENEVMAIIRDVSFEMQEQEYIKELNYKDHLTALHNRRYFEEEFEKMDKPEYLPLSIVMIDVNGLKLTNDAFGHTLGDKLLIRAAEIIHSCCENNAFAARIGGDEFVMVCPNTDSESVERIINRLYEVISKEELNNIAISVSAGWETRDSMDQSARDTFIRAENHMFKKKIVESQSMRNHTIQVIMQTLNEKNEREKQHSVKVSEISGRIGEAMSLNPQLIKELETAGMLHDIGKIAIREDVLNKPGKLTDEEYDEIKKHSESGYHILKSVDAYASMAEHILAHHEHYDGNGYPRGLKGEQISLVARIISIADAYEAMISDRPYRNGLGHENAINEIKRNSGTQFDPAIVDIFIKMFD